MCLCHVVSGSKAIERKHILAKLRRVSYIIGAVSCVLIIIGATAVLVTAPYYGYPINVGGGCFFGAMVNFLLV